MDLGKFKYKKKITTKQLLLFLLAIRMEPDALCTKASKTNE
jgi:hypothetical protein